ncbi:MAG: hypothetical protein ACOY5B_06405 [Spirochaetota bacterium]
MYWLRQALLYLFITLLLFAGIWLFWGETINQKLKEAKQDPRKEPAARQVSAVKAKIPAAKKTKTGEMAVKAEQPALSGKQAWEKTSSGFALLLQTAAVENRRLLLESAGEHERRFRAIFYKAAVQQPTGQLEQRLPKLAERQLAKPVEQRPSKRPAK